MDFKSKIKGTNRAILINLPSVVAIEEDGDNNTTIYLVGKENGITIKSPFAEVEEDWKGRDRYTGEKQRKLTQKKFPSISIGDNKFQVDIRTSEFEDGESKSLVVYSNFLTNTDDFKSEINKVDGVESFGMFQTDKYYANVSIGKMFDAEIVRENLIEAIKTHLTNN